MSLKIEHRLGVRASSDRVWEMISDLASWEHWNPIHPGASGRIGYGEKLTILEAYPHEARRTITAPVHDWAPREQLVWSQKGFLWSSLRFLEIEELGPDSCIFSNGIVFDGLRAKAELRKRARSFKLGFGILGEALKERAERPG
jgi:hypothetical protein